MMRRRRMSRGVRSIVLAAGVTLVMAACGADGNDASTASGVDCAPVVVRADSDPNGSPLPSDDRSLASAVGRSFCAGFSFTEPNGVVHTFKAPIPSSGEAACIGTELIGTLGAARVRELGFGSFSWSLLGFGLRNHAAIARPEAESIVAVFEKCSTSWKQLLIRSTTEGSEEISDTSARCTADKLSDADARLVLASEIDRAYDDRSTTAPPFGVEAEPLYRALKECLTREELAKLDWN